MTEKGRKRRGHSRFIFFFVVILVFLVSLAFFGYQWLGRQDWLNIKEIRISGNENVSKASIHALLRDFEGKNLLKISSKEARAQLLKIIRIEKVRITRLYPHTLKIKITERKGFLYVKSIEGDLFPINKDRLVMEHAIYPSKEDLPIVHSQIANKYLVVGKVIDDSFLKKVIALQNRILAERPDFINFVSEYYEDNGAVLIIDSRYGTRVLLGHQSLGEQLRRYQFVQDNGDINRKNLFDLRFKDQIVIRQEVR